MTKPEVTKTTAVLLLLSACMIFGGIIWLLIDIFGVFDPATFVITGVILFIVIFVHQQIKEKIK